MPKKGKGKSGKGWPADRECEQEMAKQGTCPKLVRDFGKDVDPSNLKGTDPEFPGCCFRFCCPPCAVADYEGECCGTHALAAWLLCVFTSCVCGGGIYTLACWDPKPPPEYWSGNQTVVINGKGLEQRSSARGAKPRQQSMSSYSDSSTCDDSRSRHSKRKFTRSGARSFDSDRGKHRDSYGSTRASRKNSYRRDESTSYSDEEDSAVNLKPSRGSKRRESFSSKKSTRESFCNTGHPFDQHYEFLEESDVEDGTFVGERKKKSSKKGGRDTSWRKSEKRPSRGSRNCR